MRTPDDEHKFQQVFASLNPGAQASLPAERRHPAGSGGQEPASKQVPDRYCEWFCTLLFHCGSITQLIDITCGHCFVGLNARLQLYQIAFGLTRLHQTLFRKTVFDHEHVGRS